MVFPRLRWCFSCVFFSCHRSRVSMERTLWICGLDVGFFFFLFSGCRWCWWRCWSPVNISALEHDVSLKLIHDYYRLQLSWANTLLHFMPWTILDCPDQSGKPMVCMDAGSMSDIEVLLCCSVNFEWLFEQFLRLCLFLFVFPACLLCLFSSSINASLVGRFWLCAWFSRQATAQWVWHLWQWVPACLQRVQSGCWVVDFVGSYALLGFYYVQVCCL